MRFTPVLLTLTLAVLGVPSASSQDGEPIPEKELPRFLGPVSSDQFTWRVVEGPDFEVYYGKANPPLAGSVGFYFGGFPQDLKPAKTMFKSRLGRFPVKWYRSIGADGSIEQEAIILIDSVMGLKAHVWAKAPKENQLDNLLSVVGQLPTFASGAVPHRFQEFHDMFSEEQRIRRLIWVCWSALMIAGAWLVDRFCRRRQVSAAFRLLIFAGVIAFAIAATIGGVAMSPAFVMDWFRKAYLLLLLAAAGSVCAVAVLLARDYSSFGYSARGTAGGTSRFVRPLRCRRLARRIGFPALTAIRSRN
jgi:hypothetical protein